MTMQLVLDTNHIISALLWGGSPGRLLDQLIRGEIPLLTSPELLSEPETTRRKPKLAARFEAQGRSIDGVMDEYRRITKMVVPADLPDGVVRDPQDKMILAAAVDGKASHLVSGDKDLTTLARYDDITILTAAELLTILAAPVDPSAISLSVDPVAD
jgi:putative PIN family toxin of toxin-antitoxin system